MAKQRWNIARAPRACANGRNLADCGSPRKSVGSIEEIGKKCYKCLTMWIVTDKNQFCGRNTDSFHNKESILWYFPQCGNYNVNFPLQGKNGLKFSTKHKVK